jgi:hypothetical protein
VRRDATALVPEQILTILEARARQVAQILRAAKIANSKDDMYRLRKVSAACCHLIQAASASDTHSLINSCEQKYATKRYMRPRRRLLRAKS